MSLFHQKTQSEHQMGIAPLDLQTLYSQLDKIGKTQGSQAQILQVQNALQDVEKSKQQLEEKKKISSASMTEEDDTQKVKDRQHQQQNTNQQNKAKESEDLEKTETEEKTQKVVFQDPNLGQHIDVIG